MKRSLQILPVVGALSAAAVLPAVAASAASPVPTLRGRAILPAEALSDGPPSGAALVTTNGITFPRPSQPVIGFSAVLAGHRPGTYLAMPDNGYGAKANSADFLIRAYEIEPEFKTAKGGSGDVTVGGYIQFRDPHGHFPYPMVDGTGRLFTGADIDPESLQWGRNGDLWMGDEFGPWILHFDHDGVLLDPPIELPRGLRSPNNPGLNGAPATVNNSRGLEAMAISPNGKHLYAILEGATVADGGAASTRRLVFEFSTRDKVFTGREWDYTTENPAHFVADAWSLDANRLVVIERDGGRGLTALFRNVYVVDVRKVPTGTVVPKRLAVDLAAIADPKLVSLPERYPGDVGLGNPFRVTCESVEAVHVLSASRLLVGCDNNLPNTGRNPGRADDTELIVIDVPGLKS